jgi:hypothetical protein
MSTLTPRYFIESLREYNQAVIWASFFINPAIAMMDSYRLKPFPCAVAYENVFSAMLEQTEGEMGVEFDWLAETFPDCQRLFQTLQRESIVEYAAVATAFLIMTNLAQKNISEVTLRGGKADYYVDGRKYLLEISGTESAEHLASRHSEKVRQLLANPFGKDGYVFVCCFSNQKAKLSFHQFESA